ncbi:GAF domain-containing protein [Hymenobacter jejuensis]|uniref:GAF domain-containing protein n=1 Tax=Hymenobacter jejuensis TaxID=2502781 RepID=A0A5B7ZZN7_9BACT|nr:GAF domain-containing protein [Hymenobacter jejuensis]QDA60674.1 GAF domain-containing protein [Hymenobacter jejuensis]
MSTIPSFLIPSSEAERLHSIRDHDLIHSLREPVFNEFVALTARIFSLPVSLIALVEETDVYYPANYGMPGHNGQPREEALCASAILHETPVVYTDLTSEQDPLITVQAAQAARNNKFQFYAAAPLCMPNQHRIGTLCIIDRHPRVFSDGERHLLENLAALVSQTLVVRHACLRQPRSGAARWNDLHTQLQEEVQALTALVRYMFTRHGTQIPVPADILTQVGRRLHDLQEILDQS